MDYLSRINQALDYIEAHLDGDIDYAGAARLAACSPYYFQRIFAFMTGMSLAEYVRLRRMSIAALELQHSQTKVIDIAVKYGYDSPMKGTAWR